MPQSRSSRLGTIVLFVASLAGLAIALYAYFTPLTGVTGTLGALVVMLACIVLAILALALRVSSSRGARIGWGIITLLGLIGTGFAALLLHQWWIVVAMVVGLVGLIASIGCPVSHDKSATA